MTLRFVVSPGGALNGALAVPGDKSISHRCAMLGAVAVGVTRVTGLLEGEDVLATLAAMRAMGVGIEGPSHGVARIHGVGRGGLRDPRADLDVGNSGTAMRLLAGLLAGQGVRARLVGDESLHARPMERVAAPLREMGATVDTAAGGRPPLEIGAARAGLTGIVHRPRVASAQVKSAVLLAGLGARGETRVIEPTPTRDHTERMLEALGAGIRRAGRETTLTGGRELVAADLDVPGDLSSAAFFMAAAAFTQGSDLRITGVGVNPTRTGVLELLRRMGADLEISNRRRAGAEPVADVRVVGTRLSAIDVPRDLVPSAIDEFPILCVAAATARGVTRIRGARELRVKESDRIAAMTSGLRRLGIEVVELEDGLDVTGGAIRGGTVHSFADHRVAMAFSMAGLAAAREIEVADCGNVSTSFPGFVEAAQGVGLGIRAERG